MKQQLGRLAALGGAPSCPCFLTHTRGHPTVQVGLSERGHLPPLRSYTLAPLASPHSLSHLSYPEDHSIGKVAVFPVSPLLDERALDGLGPLVHCSVERMSAGDSGPEQGPVWEFASGDQVADEGCPGGDWHSSGRNSPQPLLMLGGSEGYGLAPRLGGQADLVARQTWAVVPAEVLKNFGEFTCALETSVYSPANGGTTEAPGPQSFWERCKCQHHEQALL